MVGKRMTERVAGVRLAPYTTLGLGGPARAFVTATSAEEIVELVGAADRAGEPVLVLGGGSNLVVADEGFDGLVVRVASRGIEFAGDRVTVQAGEDWDGLVARMVAEGRSGIECLSGIPGLVGSTPIQNVGAYGQEVSQTITGVRVYDRKTGAVSDLATQECGFAYRHSAFKEEAGRHVVLAVTYGLAKDGMSGPVAYKELAARLGVALGERVPPAEARAAVLELRRGKGMVLDPDDPDSRSAGSFFTNPLLTAGEAASWSCAPRLSPLGHAGRLRQGSGGLADRERRVPQGLPAWSGPHLHQTHPRNDKSRNVGDDRRSSGPGP